MRIGIDLTSWANGRGYGRFSRELVHALLELDCGHDFEFFIEAQNAALLDNLSDRAEIIAVPLQEVPTEAAAADGSRSLVDLWRLHRAVHKRRPDVFFYPTVYSWFPPPRAMRNMVGIHDAIAERFPELCLPNKRARLFWNLKVKAAIRTAELVLTVSETSRRDLETILKIPAQRVRVAIEAASASFHPPADRNMARLSATAFGLSANEDFFLYVGGFNPHKQVKRLIECFHEVAKTRPNLKLLLAGTLSKDVFHGDLGELMRLRQELGLEQRVIFTDFIDDQTYCNLAATSLALVLPSLCEGFGLPAVEAAASGAAVIATQVSPLPELLAGGGIFIDPEDEKALRSALIKMSDEPEARERYAREALKRASLLSWRDAALSTLRALEELA